ncbi:hypothetical protein [Streptomyces sp. ACA25]|uniref:hypothetical protein n=1 Tax=Streptomyces sp. ACA25 TaxID=3022596 RepID=UPI003FA7C823
MNTEPPAGWNDMGFSGSKGECLVHIAEVWTDLTHDRCAKASGRFRGDSGTVGPCFTSDSVKWSRAAQVV